MIKDGDIIIVKGKRYVDFPGGKWRDHFADCNLYLIVKSINNNGTIKAKDFKNRIHFTHEKEIISCISK